MEFSLNRRSFIKAMGGAGVASLLACNNDPVKRIVSHLTPQQELTPGVVAWFASVCRECPAGCGIVVGCMEGRPIKVEGNPLHPVNNGALCARGQAALQGLYNPDRMGEPLKREDGGSLESVTWGLALGQLSDKLSELRKANALDRVVLVAPHLPSSLSSLLDGWAEENPGVRLVEYEPVSYESVEKANEFCFDRGSLPVYRLEDADLIVSFGADFLETWISPVEYASGFARMRTYSEGEIGRMLYVGSRQSLTAANADETVLIKPGGYGALAMGMIRVMLEENLRQGPPAGAGKDFEKLTRGFGPTAVYEATGVAEDRLRDLARVVAGSRRSVILPGGVESSGTNATGNIISVNILNYFLGNYGDRINVPDRDPYPRRNSARDFSLLVDQMASGEISLAIFYGVNPAYSIPSSSNLLGALEKVETVVCCSDVFNETTEIGDYLLPVHGPMESWGDCVPREGIRGLMQPVVRPLGDSKHFGEVLLELSRLTSEGSSNLAGFVTYYEYIVSAWRDIAKAVEPGKPFRQFWENALRRGGNFKAPEPSPVRLAARVSSFDWKSPLIESLNEVQSGQPDDETADTESATLIVYPSQIHYDGRGANKPWLQELQDPMFQNVWGNYLEVPEKTARRIGLDTGDVLKVTSPYSTLECPVHVSRRAHDDVVAISMGQGHTRYGRFADKTGVNPVTLLPRSFDEMSGQGAYLSVNVKLEKTGGRKALPTPEGNPYDEGRGIAQTMALGALRDLTREEQFELPHDEEEFKELLSPHDHPRHRWGMVIDLNLCNGCGACVVACYAENNISVVGREQYSKGREMTWMRVERYFTKGRPDDVMFVPVLCQHCDDAPCETVCPVYATYHTPEGLNAQIYNRCVGTRYCANNCPYGVRRFNWFAYKFPEPLNQQLNPNVTVRSKGVMEKCSFCVQRIAAARGKAKDEKRRIRDGEVITACSQTCPTGAITFGDLKDPDTAVSRKTRNARGYKILEHINTKPAVTYLKKISGREYIG